MFPEKTLDEKMSIFFSAIDDISLRNDGSVVIEWKSNVWHSVKGSHVVSSSNYNINSGREVHLNPPWDLNMIRQDFDFDNPDAILTGQERKIMAHKFVVKDGDDFLYFDKYEDIPMEFDHLIKFEPEIPAGPHTAEQHEEIEQWNDKIKQLMKRERK